MNSDSHITHNKEELFNLCGGGYVKQYPVILNLKALPVLLLAAAFFGCSSEAGNSGQNFSNQMVEASIIEKIPSCIEYILEREQ